MTGQQSRRARAVPSLAEQARTALAGAGVASLVTRVHRPAGALTIVAVTDQPDGCPIVWLEPRSPVVRGLARCSVATLFVSAPSPFRFLRLTGALGSCRSTRPTLRAYRMDVLSAHLVGAQELPLPLEEFLGAEPDPLRQQVDRILNHLEDTHADELLACVRAHGIDAVAVVPRGLDRYGIELAAICPDGISSVRLTFPDAPVDDLASVSPGLRLPLTCRCNSTSGPSSPR